MNIEQARFNMIEQHVKPWKVFDQKLLGAMSVIPREQFINEENHGIAYADLPIPLGHRQSMLAPREIARLIQSLEIDENSKVLEIGTGSGYSSAVLSKLANHVFSIEIMSDFVSAAKKTHKKLGIENVTVEEGDARDGWNSHAPYDAILITAALPKLPDSFKANLSQNGKIVCILEHQGGQMVTLVQLDNQDQWQYEYLFPIQTQTMINAEATNQFVF